MEQRKDILITKVDYTFHLSRIISDEWNSGLGSTVSKTCVDATCSYIDVLTKASHCVRKEQRK